MPKLCYMFDYEGEEQIGLSFICPHCKETIAIIEKPLRETDAAADFLDHVDTIWKPTSYINECPVCGYEITGGWLGFAVLTKNWCKEN